MTSVKIVGDESGIALWNLMAFTNDEIERAYFTRLNDAAAKFGSIWFTDTVTQRTSNSNQTTWGMKWDGEQWKISLFHIPEGAEKVTARIKGEEPEVELVELDIDDLILVED